MSKFKVSLILIGICSVLVAFPVIGYKSAFLSIAHMNWESIPREVTEGVDELLNEIAVEGYKVIPLKKVKI